MSSIERLGFSKFYNSVSPLAGKKSTEAQRVLCACHLIRNMIWDLLVEPECREAVEIAEQFSLGKADKKQLLTARKTTRKPPYDLQQRWTGSQREAKRQAASIAHSVTCSPFGRTALGGVASGIVNALTHLRQANHPDQKWREAEDAVYDMAYETMADLALGFLKIEPEPGKEILSLLDDPQLSRYYVQFINPYQMQYWVRLNVEDRAEKQQLEAAFQCFFDAARRASCSVLDLAAVQQVALSPTRAHREFAVQMLLLLGMHHAAARDVLFGLLDANRADVRFTMISHFQFHHLPFPQEYVLMVIADGLADASSKVRIMAVQACVNYNEMAAVPFLIERQQVEKNDDVLKTLAHDIPLIRDGYYVDDVSEKTASIHVRRKQGGMIGKLVDKAGLTPAKISQVVEELLSCKF
jgi:hypothetical protein